MVETAKKFFHGEEGYNCAQAVLAAFADKYEVSQQTLDEFKAFGGGRVDGGTCGAIYAALHIAKKEDSKEKLKAVFTEKAGSIRCKDIKQIAKLPCRDCVGLAAATLQEHD